jgi:hypothetical protein
MVFLLALFVWLNEKVGCFCKKS